LKRPGRKTRLFLFGSQTNKETRYFVGLLKGLALP
jgi:hypothetical protein